MTREYLAEIRSRFEKYLEWPDVERRKFFEMWQDKRDLHDLIDGLDRMLAGRDAESGTEGLMRIVADALASVVADRALELEARKSDDLRRDNWGLKRRVAELEAQVKFPPKERTAHEATFPADEEKLKALIRLENEREYVKRLRVEAQGVCMCVTVNSEGQLVTCLSCCAKAELRRRGLSGL